jgi:cytochrome P450
MVMHDIAVDGFRLEAGTLAVVGIYAMHRDPELWDDPLVFDPDRFSKERSAGRSRWQYLPFGGVRRSCVGDHFAMLEATLALATIVRQVEIRSLDDDFPVATPFTLVAAAPIRAQVQPRDAGHLLFSSLSGTVSRSIVRVDVAAGDSDQQREVQPPICA